ncbi:uncharacterized protein ACA1_022040 [Acanthamoeba castellanii str. Neff]|uniref:Uncharacterized protein n=1 Tax=Acanthamoeba castellanii (strain ATCC 30010 / Neff) TaxID=1257118 RepID=L8GCM2_ACACF|nr:uncharacterized protein ACA1_022040 [Acanthamoeba castellanii str. Neff]ELR10827.1 hypothetical protein ACA1_022040 [Acanthamoeba castellanii str. Neff]
MKATTKAKAPRKTTDSARWPCAASFGSTSARATPAGAGGGAAGPLTYREVIDAGYFFPSANSIDFQAGVRVLKNESQGQGATSALTPDLQRAVDRVTGGPHSSSLLRLNSSLQCYQPPPVSAKLESGAPFVNSSDDGYSIVDYYQLRYFSALSPDGKMIACSNTLAVNLFRLDESTSKTKEVQVTKHDAKLTAWDNYLVTGTFNGGLQLIDMLPIPSKSAAHGRLLLMVALRSSPKSAARGRRPQEQAQPLRLSSWPCWMPSCLVRVPSFCPSHCHRRCWCCCYHRR